MVISHLLAGYLPPICKLTPTCSHRITYFDPVACSYSSTHIQLFIHITTSPIITIITTIYSPEVFVKNTLLTAVAQRSFLVYWRRKGHGHGSIWKDGYQKSGENL